MARAIETVPVVRTAAEHLRISFDLLARGVETAASEAYLAVEGLVLNGEFGKDWHAFGEALAAAGGALGGDDLMTLWASCQLYRHDATAQTRARRRLQDLGRDALDHGTCCWRAAEILEAFVLGESKATDRGPE